MRVADFDLDVHLGGYGVVFDGLNEASTTGAATLIVYAHVLMVLLLFVFFRHWLPVIITLGFGGHSGGLDNGACTPRRPSAQHDHDGFANTGIGHWHCGLCSYFAKRCATGP